jgi:hypothetical protein
MTGKAGGQQRQQNDFFHQHLDLIGCRDVQAILQFKPQTC